MYGLSAGGGHRCAASTRRARTAQQRGGEICRTRFRCTCLCVRPIALYEYRGDSVLRGGQNSGSCRAVVNPTGVRFGSICRQPASASVRWIQIPFMTGARLLRSRLGAGPNLPSTWGTWSRVPERSHAGKPLQVPDIMNECPMLSTAPALEIEFIPVFLAGACGRRWGTPHAPPAVKDRHREQIPHASLHFEPSQASPQLRSVHKHRTCQAALRVEHILSAIRALGSAHVAAMIHQQAEV